jgi:hypothetical protein
MNPNDPAQRQAQFQFGSNPYSQAAMMQALGQGQNQLGAATGTAGTDLAKIMQILRQKKLLDALQNQGDGLSVNDFMNQSAGNIGV